MGSGTVQRKPSIFHEMCAAVWLSACATNSGGGLCEPCDLELQLAEVQGKCFYECLSKVSTSKFRD